MKYFCPLPWMSLEVDAMGVIKPCCLSEEPIMCSGEDRPIFGVIAGEKQGSPATIQHMSLSEAFQSLYMENLRHEFLDGKQPQTCKKCWDSESAGAVSKRMQSVMRYGSADKVLSGDLAIQFLDMKLGNICNIKCRVCGDVSSSQWATETFKHATWDYKPRYQIVSKSGRWPRENNRFWEDLESLLPNIRFFEITGGEPFLIEEQFAVLQKAVELGYAKDIFIHYNTNGTVYPGEALTRIWPHFKGVEIAFSVDNVGKRFELERHPAKWEEVSSNIEKINSFKPNGWLKTQVCCTINKQNILYLPEITDYILNNNFDSWHYNLLHSQPMFSVSSFAPKVKAQITSLITKKMSALPIFETSVRPVLNFMNTPSPNLDAEFLHRMHELDSWRGEAFKDTHPELYTLLNE